MAEVNKLNIVYVGNDAWYLGFVEETLKKRLGSRVEVKTVNVSVTQNLSQTVKDIVDSEPRVLIFDYSFYPDFLAKVSSFVSKLYPLSEVPQMGLIDGLEPLRDVEKLILTTSASIIFYKPEKYIDIGNAAVMLIGKNDSFWTKMEESKFEYPTIMKTVCRICYVAEDYIHIESNLDLVENAYYYFTADQFNRFYFNCVRILKKLNNDLYYNYKNSYNLKYSTFKELELRTIDNAVDYFKEVEIDGGENKLVGFGEEQFKYIKGYITKNKTVANSKKERLLVVDVRLDILSQSKRSLDEFSYSIRAHYCFDKNFNVILNTLPGVISIVLDSKINTIPIVENMIKFVQAQQSYMPLLVVFDPEELLKKTALNYSKLMVINEFFNFERISKFMAVYMDKGGRTVTHLTAKSLAFEKRVYYSKKQSESIGHFHFPVKIVSFSDNALLLFSKKAIPMQVPFQLEYEGMTLLVTVTNFPNNIDRPNKDFYFAILSKIAKNEMAKYNQILLDLIEKKAEADAELAKKSR